MAARAAWCWHPACPTQPVLAEPAAAGAACTAGCWGARGRDLQGAGGARAGGGGRSRQRAGAVHSGPAGLGGPQPALPGRTARMLRAACPHCVWYRCACRATCRERPCARPDARLGAGEAAACTHRKPQNSNQVVRGRAGHVSRLDLAASSRTGHGASSRAGDRRRERRGAAFLTAQGARGPRSNSRTDDVGRLPSSSRAIAAVGKCSWRSAIRESGQGRHDQRGEPGGQPHSRAALTLVPGAAKLAGRASAPHRRVAHTHQRQQEAGVLAGLCAACCHLVGAWQRRGVVASAAAAAPPPPSPPCAQRTGQPLSRCGP